jgi:hypothetical protein
MGLDGSAWVMEPVLLLDTLFLKGISADLIAQNLGIPETMARYPLRNEQHWHNKMAFDKSKFRLKRRF